MYVLCAPPLRKPFYVGVGTGRRLLDHAICARRLQLDSHKLRVIRELWRSGFEIDYQIHGFYRERTQAERAEAALILRLGRRDLKTGLLTNVTAGGEGAPSPSDATILSRSMKLKEAWAKRDKSAAMAHLRTSDVQGRAAASRRGQKRGSYSWSKSPGANTPERKAALSARLRANPISRVPGVAEKISVSKRGKSINSWMRTSEAKARFARGAHPRARPVEIEGRVYACKTDAAEALNVCYATISGWLRLGRHGARYIKR